MEDKVITLTSHMGEEIEILLEEIFEEISNEDLMQRLKIGG